MSDHHMEFYINIIKVRHQPHLLNHSIKMCPCNMYQVANHNHTSEELIKENGTTMIAGNVNEIIVHFKMLWTISIYLYFNKQTLLLSFLPSSYLALFS